jgi:hypothetical protein
MYVQPIHRKLGKNSSFPLIIQLNNDTIVLLEIN